MKHKVIVNVPDCKLEEYQAQQKESYTTWVPLLENRGVRVIKSISNPNLYKDYEIIDNDLYCKCTDDLDNNFILKRFYFIKWAVETQDFDYLFITSLDTFVHPDRFLNIIDEYTEMGNVDIAGCACPYLGWDPYSNFKIFLDDLFYSVSSITTKSHVSGGSGYVLSYNSCKIILEEFEKYENSENLPWDDLIFSRLLINKNISVLHDNRFLFSSPKLIYWDQVGDRGVPRIDTKEGDFLAVQHPLDGCMVEMMNNLKLNMEKTKFGIYTTFYNCERFIDRVFSNIEKLNYNNFEWHIANDYSTDNTEKMVLDRLEKSPIKHKIKFFNQSEKKEMYWKPNLFFDNSFDWIVLIDADDEVDSNFLKVYDFFAQNDDELSLISSDFHKINESENSLHSISYILNDEIISKKIDRYHPSTDYLKNTSYSCFGHLRAFKHSKIDEFVVDDMLACAEDSYHVFWANSYGKYLSIPRPLYKWYLRNDSESHNVHDINQNFNGNFNIAISKLKFSDFGVSKILNDLYIETCALGSYDIGELSNKKVSLWTRYLSSEQKEILNNLYLDCDLRFNENDCDINIFCLNYFNNKVLDKTLENLKLNKVLFYYQNQNYHTNIDELFEETRNKLNEYSPTINKFVGYSWWMYFRHLILKN